MADRILITGASGFVGPHLIRELAGASPPPEVFAWQHERPPQQLEVRESSDVDLLDTPAVEDSIRRIQPTHLVHLAAISNVPQSFANPRHTWLVNVIGTLNLLEALKRHSSGTKVLVISSSEVYGRSFSSAQPLAEDAPTRPMNPYAASKLAAETLCGTYRDQGMRIIIARPFNHIGPGQAPSFAIPSFALQLAEVAAGLRAPRLRVGNLDACRDLLHVSDVVRAYALILSRFDDLPNGQVYNVCSGTPRRIGDVLDQLIELNGLAVEVEQDPDRMRPSDIPMAIGDASLLSEATGWQPKTPWSQALRECLDEARVRIGSTR